MVEAEAVREMGELAAKGWGAKRIARELGLARPPPRPTRPRVGPSLTVDVPSSGDCEVSGLRSKVSRRGYRCAT